MIRDYDINVSKGIEINCPRSQVFRYWRDLRNLPRIMPHLESVEPIDERRSHWVANGPMGIRAEWDAEIVNEKKDQEIAWRSVEGSDVPNRGRVRFQDAGDHATRVNVDIAIKQPGGRFAKAAAGMMGGSPEEELEKDLKEFKEMMEHQK